MKTLLYGNGLWIKQNPLFKYDTTGEKLNNAIKDINHEIEKYGDDFEGKITRWLTNIGLDRFIMNIYGLNSCNKAYFFNTIKRLLEHEFGDNEYGLESEVHSILWGFISKTNQGEISDKLFKTTYSLVFAILTKALFSEINIKEEMLKSKKVKLKHRYENIFTTNYISYFDNDIFIHGSITKSLEGDQVLNDENYIKEVTKNYFYSPGIIGHRATKENILGIFEDNYDKLLKRIPSTEVHIIGMNIIGDNHLIEKIAKKTKVIYYYHSDQDRIDAVNTQRIFSEKSIVFNIMPLSAFENDSEEIIEDVPLKTQFSRNASLWPYNLIEKRKGKNKTFDKLYAQYESMWHYESLINIESVEFGNISDVEFVSSAVSVMGIVEKVGDVFSEIGVRELFAPDFKNIILENVDLTAGRFWRRVDTAMYLENDVLIKMGMVRKGEELPKTPEKLAYAIIRHIRNKIVHYNSSKYGVIHIGGNFQEQKNYFGFKSSFDSKANFSVNKNIYYLIYRNLKFYVEKNMKIWSQIILDKLDADYRFQPLSNTKMKTIISGISFDDYGEDGDLVSYDSYIFSLAIKSGHKHIEALTSIVMLIFEIKHFVKEFPYPSLEHVYGIEDKIDTVFNWTKMKNTFLLNFISEEGLGYASEKLGSWPDEEYIDYFPGIYTGVKNTIGDHYDKNISLFENIINYVISENIDKLYELDKYLNNIKDELYSTGDPEKTILKIFEDK